MDTTPFPIPVRFPSGPSMGPKEGFKGRGREPRTGPASRNCTVRQGEGADHACVEDIRRSGDPQYSWFRGVSPTVLTEVWTVVPCRGCPAPTLLVG